MPMIDVYATPGTFSDKHALAQDLAQAARAEMAALAEHQTTGT